MSHLIPPPFRKVPRDVPLNAADDAVLEAWVLANTPLDFTEFCEYEWTNRPPAPPPAPPAKTPFPPIERRRDGCLFHEWVPINTIGYGTTERVCAACGLVEVLKPVAPPTIEF